MTKPNPFTAGQVAYTAGKPCKPPATLHGADQVRWLSGWRNAEAAHLREQAAQQERATLAKAWAQ